MKFNLDTSLEDIRKLLAEAEFDKAWKLVEPLPSDAIPDGRQMSDPRAADALKFRSMAAEVCDYKGRYERARDFVEAPGRYCYARLRELRLHGAKAASPKRKRDILQQVWVLLQAGLCEYRATRFDSALDIFELCRRVAASPYVSDDNSPRYGTQARAEYSLGLVYREQYDLKGAVRSFTTSTQLGYQSLVFNSGNHAVSSKLSCVAIARSIGMGLASVHNSLGRPDLALPLLLAAKAMLPAGAGLISTHLDMIRATLAPLAGEGGSSYLPSANEETIDELKRCYTTFERAGHWHYKARAAYSLAAEYVQLAQDGAVRERVKESALRQAEVLLPDLQFSNSGDLRFEFSALSLRSDIARLSGDYDRARELATLGLRETKTFRHPQIHLQLLTARALARQTQDVKAAMEDFRGGLEIAKRAGNHRLHAWFLLYLTQAHLRLGQDREATQCFTQFRELEQFLEVKTADIVKLTKETEAEFKRRGPDLILKVNDEFDPEEAQRQFQRFLVEWARSRTNTDAEAADKLKISRQTLYNWIQKQGPA